MPAWVGPGGSVPVADFPGVDYRTGLVGTGYIDLKNVSHIDRNVLRHRPGYERKAQIAGRVASPFGGSIALQASDNTLRMIDGTTYAVSASKATLDATTGCFARFGGRLYWSNGVSGPFVMDTPTGASRTPGITAPAGTIGAGTVANTGSMKAGAHLFRYRYKNAATGFLSNPSGAITKTVVDNDQVTFSIGVGAENIVRSLEAWPDRIVVEVTLAAGGAFYAAYEVAMSASSVVVNGNDIFISAQTPALVYGDDGHNPMPKFDLIFEHRSRFFGLLASSKLLAWSRPGYPESWDITQYARKLSNYDANDLVVGGASFLGDLYLFNLYGMARFTYADAPDSGAVLAIPTDQGLWNQHCVVCVNNVMYGFGPGGIWQISSMNPEKISVEVDPFIQANYDIAQSADFFGWYNQDDRSITWMFTAVGDTEPKLGITYSIATQKWSTRSYKHELLGGVYAYQKNYLFANGYTWQEKTGYYDGVATVVPVTATTTATDIIVPVETMADYIGGHLTFGTETRLITAYGANSLTVATPFTAVAVGQVGFVGAAPVALETNWIADPDMVGVKNPTTVAFEFEPAQATRSLLMKVYTDFSTGPVLWYRDTADTSASGVSFANGADAITIAGDGGSGRGFVPVPLQAKFHRCIKLRVEVNEPIQPFGLISMRLASREAVQKTPGSGE